MNVPHSQDEFLCDLPQIGSVLACVREQEIDKADALFVLSYKLMLIEMTSNLVLFLFFFYLPLPPPHLPIE